MGELNIGDKAPDFTMITDGENRISLSDFSGRSLLLYFYPKDDTPGCTKEACGFRDNLSALSELDVSVIGVSRDPVSRHKKFKVKHELNFPLASDEEGEVCEKYGVWKEKSMYGRKYMGIERSTFLIDGKGVIQRIWRKVKVTGHVEEILKEISSRSRVA